MEGVVASIKPVHSLVAGVMEGVAEPLLLVEGAGSPHSYAMRPSQAAMLEEAPVVFWVGEGMETFLAEPLQSLASDAGTVALEDAEGLTLLEYREGGVFGEHQDGHEPHGEHGEGGHHHEEGDDNAGHDHSGHDMHIWLDPRNAAAMVDLIATTLFESDPKNAETYAANAKAMKERLAALEEEITAELAPLGDRPFVVFHDAYHYFENRFGLEAAGAITVNPEVDPGARRIAEMQETVRALNAACVFSEPQFEPRIVEVVAEGSDAESGVLDPLGAGIEDGPELYFELMRGMAASFKTCLSSDG
jgi:zinc transport system substrate-binding protein